MALLKYNVQHNTGVYAWVQVTVRLGLFSVFNQFRAQIDCDSYSTGLSSLQVPTEIVYCKVNIAHIRRYIIEDSLLYIWVQRRTCTYIQAMISACWLLRAQEQEDDFCQGGGTKPDQSQEKTLVNFFHLFTHCVKHNQYEQHDYVRGSGCMPPRKNLKIRHCEIESGSFLRCICDPA